MILASSPSAAAPTAASLFVAPAASSSGRHGAESCVLICVGLQMDVPESQERRNVLRLMNLTKGQETDQ
jgi:hypothetical protein